MAELPLDPDDIARKSFTSGFRGFEAQEVRAYLHDLARQVRAEQSARFELETRVAELEPLAASNDAPIDENRLIELVGEETARVLQTARQASDEIRAKAEEHAARLVREGTDDIAEKRAASEAEAADILSRASTELETRSAEAEAAAGTIIARAERDAKTITDEATAELESAQTKAAEAIAAAEAKAEQIEASAREAGRAMVAEAQAVRERVLRDLARRRQTSKAQVERLNAGRERLLGAYDVVRKTLDEATHELTLSVTEARVAAEAAARRVEDEPEATIEELESELEVARLASLPVLDSPELELELEPEAEAEAEVEPEPEAESVSEPETEVVAAPVEDPPPPITLPAKRRRGRKPPDDVKLPPAELQPLTEPHAVEEVRVLTPEPEPEPEPAAESPAPESEVEEPVLVEPSTNGGSTDQQEPSGDLGEEGADAEGEDSAASSPEVETLFARIRAERAEALAAAEEVLAEADDIVAELESDVVEAEEVEAEEVEVEAELDLVVVADDPASVALAERSEALAPLERDLGRKLKRTLADEQNELLDALRRSPKTPIAELLGPVADQIDSYVTASTAPLERAIAAGATWAGGHGSTPSGDGLAHDLAAAITNRLRGRIERAAEEAGGDVDDLDARLRACYREWKTAHLPEAVGDAMVAAWSTGVRAGKPAHCGLAWLVAPNSPPCPDADDNALAGVLDDSTEFPTGSIMPPAHPGCRCLLVPQDQ